MKNNKAFDIYRGIKTVFQDVDGCLEPQSAVIFPVGGKGAFSASHQEILQKIGRAIDASYIEEVIINTGRSWDDVKIVADTLASKKIRYVLTEHCGSCFDMKEQVVLDLQTLAVKYGLKNISEKYNALGGIKELIKWYHLQGRQVLEKRFGLSLEALDKKTNLSIAVPAGTDGEVLISALKEEGQKFLPQIDFSRMNFCLNHIYIDVLGEVEKSDGAEILLAHTGQSAGNACAVGDHRNDISIFNLVSRVFCPDNAHESVQSICRAKNCVISDKSMGQASLQFYQQAVL